MKYLILLTFLILNLKSVYSQKNIMTVIHADVKGGTTTPMVDNFRYNNLKTMVDSATANNIKLTIMLNPYFCGIILNDVIKYNQVQQWQLNGHEIAGLHRGLTHYEWDGYTNLPPDTVNAYHIPNGMADYIGPMSVFDSWLDSIAMSPINLYSTYDTITEFDWKQGAYIQGTGDGMAATPSSGYFNVQPATVNNGIYTVCQVKYYFVETTTKVSDIINLYSTQPEMNVGIVTHPSNFGNNPTYFYDWLNFIKNQQLALTGISKTATEIIENSVCYTLLGVDENESALSQDLFIFPNPTVNELHLFGIQAENIEYKIFSTLGQQVLFGFTNNPTIDVSMLTDGVYFAHFSDTKNQVKIIKFIKNSL